MEISTVNLRCGKRNSDWNCIHMLYHWCTVGVEFYQLLRAGKPETHVVVVVVVVVTTGQSERMAARVRPSRRSILPRHSVHSRPATQHIPLIHTDKVSIIRCLAQLCVSVRARVRAHMHAHAVPDDADFSAAADPNGQICYFDAILCAAPDTRKKRARVHPTHSRGFLLDYVGRAFFG